MATNLEWALKYASKGFYVLPMVDKRPIIKFADQPPLTKEQITKIWTENPNANIAVRTVDFFVIDIDRHDGGADGYESIKKYEKNSLLVDTLTQRTAGGGLQLFYLKPKNIEVQQNIGWLDGVDVKAHINNYVMVPPSRNKGNQYEWVDKSPIVTPSVELIKAINKTDKPTSSLQSLYQNYNAGQSRTSKLFETVVNGLGDSGGRNNALTEFVGGLLFRNVGIDETIQLAEIANQNTADPLSDSEFTTTVESMIKKEIRRRGDGGNQ